MQAAFRSVWTQKPVPLAKFLLTPGKIGIAISAQDKPLSSWTTRLSIHWGQRLLSTASRASELAMKERQ